MHRQDSFLLVENDFYSTFLVSMWLDSLSDLVSPSSVLVRGAPGAISLKEDILLFHNRYSGQRMLERDAAHELSRLYPEISDVGLSLVGRLGIPAHPIVSLPDECFIGEDLNSESVKSRMQSLWASASLKPSLFIFVDQILSSWWIDLTAGYIFNGHPAVLPYARGFRAIEGIARLQDESLFRLACGACVHYVDAGIDTGPIVRAERLTEPFASRSLSDLRAQLFELVFRLLVETSHGLMAFPDTVPAGTVVDKNTQGRLFLRRESTKDSRREAVEGYLAMKESSATR